MHPEQHVHRHDVPLPAGGVVQQRAAQAALPDRPDDGVAALGAPPDGHVDASDHAVVRE